jgi:hypothetical protein
VSLHPSPWRTATRLDAPRLQQVRRPPTAWTGAAQGRIPAQHDVPLPGSGHPNVLRAGYLRTLTAFREAGRTRRVWPADAPLGLRPPAYRLDAF